MIFNDEHISFLIRKNLLAQEEIMKNILVREDNKKVKHGILE